MISFYSKRSKKEPFTPITEPLPGSWIHVDEAKHDDLITLSRLTGLDVSIFYDALDRYELPRFESFPNYFLIFTRHPADEGKFLYTNTLTILITPHYFITISPIKSALVLQVLQNEGSATSSNPSEWMRDILLWITQEFNIFVRKTRHSVISQEKELGSVTSEDIYALTKNEEILNQYLSSLDAFSLTLEKLFVTGSTFVYKQNKAMIEDILNNVKQAESLCEIIIKNIRSLRDSYQIIFANNLTKTIKLLTSLTIVFTIPNIVASIYGMNVRLPLANNPDAFSLLMVTMFLLSGLCGYWFYRKNWL